jgi:signal transduction histidine kinase
MLLDGDLDQEQTKRVVSNIHRAAGRMRELLTDLAHSSLGCTETAPRCNLRAMVAAACEASGAAARDGIELHVDVPARIEVPMAGNRMARVFLNLIANALEAMPGGGTIRIGARRASDSVVVELEDSGPGIPAEIRGRLFEPFVTARKEGGLGLGLALSRQTVRDHGGEMWIEPAAGARFVISLPLRSRLTGGNHEFGM